MHYRKQPDGRSWLIFELTDNNQKRGMALVRRADAGPDPLIEWLTSSEDEKPAVLALGKKILEKQPQARRPDRHAPRRGSRSKPGQHDRTGTGRLRPSNLCTRSARRERCSDG